MATGEHGFHIWLEHRHPVNKGMTVEVCAKGGEINWAKFDQQIERIVRVVARSTLRMAQEGEVSGETLRPADLDPETPSQTG